MPIVIFGIAFTAAQVATAVIAAVLMLGTLVLGLAMKPKTPSSAANTLTQTLDPNAFRVTVLGKCPCGNNEIYWEVWGRTYFTQVIAAATHPITSWGNTYIQGVQLSISGNIITGTYAWGVPGQVGYQATTTNYNGMGIYWKSKGISGVTISTPSSSVGAGTLWSTTTASFTGCAYYVINWNADPKYLPGGIPSQICQVVEGSPVYDPRRDTTVGGSGSHRANDNTTWEYSPTDSNGVPIGRNNALQMLRYLLGWWIPNQQTSAPVQVDGRGVNPVDIDYASFISAANSCETAGFYSDIALSTGDSHTTNEATIASGAQGILLDAGGLWGYKVAVDDTASIAYAFTDDDVVSGISWVPKTSITTMYNQVRGNFCDPSVNAAVYQSWPYPTVMDATYLSQDDGFARFMQLDLLATQDPSLAQKLARIALNKSRLTGQFSATFRYTALKAQLYDCVTLSFTALGFVNRLFRIIKMSLNPIGGVDLVLQEEESSVYTGGTITTYVTPVAGNQYNHFQQIDIGTLTLTAVQIGTSSTVAHDGIEVAWSALGSDASYVELGYKKSSDTLWSDGGSIDAGSINTIIPSLLPSTSYDVTARAWSVSGIAGVWETATISTNAYTTATQNQTYYQVGDPVGSYAVNDGAIWTIPGGATYLRTGGAWVQIATAPAVSDGTVLYTNSTPGAFSYTVASTGLPHVWIEGWGFGGTGNNSGGKTPTFYGGSGASYFKHYMAVTPGSTVISGTIGAAGSTSTDGGATSVTSPSLNAPGGKYATTSAAGAAPAAATGGSVINGTGSAGGSPNTYTGGAASNGGAAQTSLGDSGNAPGGGGAGGISVAGGTSRIVITAKT